MKTHKLNVLLAICAIATSARSQVNDFCENAIPIYDGSTSFSTYEDTFTDGPPDPLCYDSESSQIRQDIWYNYTAMCDGQLQVSSCTSGFDTRVAIYEGFSCIGNILACNDDWCGLQSQLIAMPVTLGDEYKIRVGGYLLAHGSGTINISCSDIQFQNQDLGGGCPIPPPKADDRTFVASSPGDPSSPAYSPGLDTACVGNNHEPLIVKIPVTRYLGPVDFQGNLFGAPQLVAGGYLEKYAVLTIPAFDVDSGYSGPNYAPEEDKVYFNNEAIDFAGTGNPAILQGEQECPAQTFGRWTLNRFLIPIEKVRFPANRGVGGNAPNPGFNTIRIEVDSANSQSYWCSALDWASLEIRCISPIILIHGNNSQGEFFNRQEFTTKLEEKKIPYDCSINLVTNSVEVHADLLNSDLAPEKPDIPEIVKSFGVDSVHLVAHSKGGLDARRYLAVHQPARNSEFRVLSLTTLSTPHDGSVLADVVEARKKHIGFSVDADFDDLPAFLDLLSYLNAATGYGDMGRPNLTTSFCSSFNQQNVQSLPSEVTYNAVAGDTDHNGNGRVDSSLEYSGIYKEDRILRGTHAVNETTAAFMVDRLYQTVRRAKRLSITTMYADYDEVETVTAVLNDQPLGNDTLVSIPSGLGQGSNYFSSWIENKGKHLVFQGAGQRRDHGDIANDGVAGVVVNWIKPIEEKNGDLK